MLMIKRLSELVKAGEESVIILQLIVTVGALDPQLKKRAEDTLRRYAMWKEKRVNQNG